MSVSIQSPIATFDNGLIKKSKYLMVRTFAIQQAKNVGKSEDRVKALMQQFSADIHSGSTGGINVRI